MAVSLSALNRGRRAAEADMRDKCRITGPSTGEKVWSPELLKYIEAPPPVIYEGKCKLAFGSVSPRDMVAGDQIFTEQVGKLSVPVVTPAAAVGAVEDIARGHKLHVLSSVTDPMMASAVFDVGARRLRSNPTSRRFLIEETQ